MSLFLLIDPDKKVDTLSFFPLENAIVCPGALWFSIIAASLRRKHSVLVLETPLETVVPESTKQWVLGDNWCWLSPRALGPIRGIYSGSSLSYLSFKSQLSNAK